MLGKSRYERKRDQYGNIIEEIRRGRDSVDETKRDYDLKGRIVREWKYYSRSEQFDTTCYKYEEDAYGNVEKEIVAGQDEELDENGNKVVVGEYRYVYEYINVYNEYKELQSTAMYGEEKEFYWVKRYFYKEGLLHMEEMENREGSVRKVYYTYNDKKELVEKEFRLEKGEDGYEYFHVPCRSDFLDSPKTYRYARSLFIRKWLERAERLAAQKSRDLAFVKL